MVFLHQVIHDMLGSAECLNVCRDQKINIREVRELLGTIPPDSEAMGNLVKAVMLHNHLQKQKLPRVSDVIDEVIDVSTSPSLSRSMSQPRPKSCAQAGPARPQASRASPAQPKPAVRPKTFAQPTPAQAESAARPKTFARPIPGQAHKKCAHPPKGHGKTSGQKGKKEQASEMIFVGKWRPCSAGSMTCVRELAIARKEEQKKKNSPSKITPNKYADRTKHALRRISRSRQIILHPR